MRKKNTKSGKANRISPSRTLFKTLEMFSHTTRPELVHSFRQLSTGASQSARINTLTNQNNQGVLPKGPDHFPGPYAMHGILLLRVTG